MPEQLKPCPVPDCKGTPFLLNAIFTADARIRCTGCGCTTKRYDTWSDAIAAWNNRPDFELERLAREVVKSRCNRNTLRDVAEELSDALGALAAYLDKEGTK